MNIRRTTVKGAIPKLVIPELRTPKFSSEYTSLRTNADRMMQDVLSVVDSIRELQKDSTVLSGVYALLNDAVIRLSDDGTITDLNDSAEKMFGVAWRDVAKRDVEYILGIPFERIVSCARDSTPFESKLLRKNTEDFFHASISVTSIRHLSANDGVEYVIIVRDVSDIVSMKTALSETDVKFEALYKALDEASDVIIITDKQNKIIFVNRAFTKHTGYTFEEAVGNNPGFYKSGDLPQSFYDDMWVHLNMRQPWQGTLINRHKSGAVLYDKTIITPVMNGDPNRPSYYIAVKQIAYDKKETHENQRQMQLRFNSEGL